MRWFCLALLLPALAGAQDFPFTFDPCGISLQIGEWAPQCPWAQGMSESAPSFCDLDADGDYDLFIGQFMDYITYYVNQGNASQPDLFYITSAYDSLYCLSGSSSSLDFGDLDNDGDYDIVMGQGYGAIYWNGGTTMAPTFLPQPDTLYSTQGGLIVTTHPELADIDADGDLDLIAGHYSGIIYFCRNVGLPDSAAFSFESGQWLGIDVGYAADPALCDLDADGDLDLLVGNSYGKIWYYRNDGDSANYNFTYVTNNWLGIDVGDHAAPEFCDIDGDGDFDLFVGREPYLGDILNGDVFFYENIGSAGVPVFQYITSNYLTIDVGSNCIPQLLDMDADGDLDLMVGVGHRLRHFRNDGDAQNPSFILETQQFQGIGLLDIQPYFCDIDADSDYDLFAGTSDIPGPPGLHLYLNQGTPQTPNYVLYSSDLLPNNYFVIITPSLADIDADGDYDLFIFDDWGDLYYYQNVGTPERFQFQFETQTWQGIGTTDHRCARFHDIDNDEDLDLFFASNLYGSQAPGNLYYYENIGTPQQAQMVQRTEEYLPIDIADAAPWFGDSDSDGLMDLFVGESSGGIMFFHGTDTSGFVLPPAQRHPRAGLLISLGPNPANPFVAASFELRAASNISLDVFDLLGRRVAELASGFHLPGEYRYVWDAGKCAAGVYFIRLRAGEEKRFEKLVLLK